MTPGHGPNPVDVILIGTGLAPLVAATKLLSEGASFVILNPDRDFFLEDSELPWDPDPAKDPLRFAESRPEALLQSLRPDFPGAVELWPGAGGTDATGFRDLTAPHVRTRSRLWLEPIPTAAGTADFEDSFLRFEEAGWDARLLEGLPASHRFPGHSKKGGESARALRVSGIADVDVTRYRYGLLEYVRERVGGDHLFRSAHGIELIPDGVRFQVAGESRTARARVGVLAFWTPKLSSLVLSWTGARAKGSLPKDFSPSGLRAWEEWSIRSKEALDWETIAHFEDLAVFAEGEGAPHPEKPLHRLGVWTRGRLLPPESTLTNASGGRMVSGDSIESIARLCMEFLGWPSFTARSVKPRVSFEWPVSRGVDTVELSHGGLRTRVVSRADGPVASVARVARSAAGEMLG